MRECKAAVDDVEKIVNMIKSFTSPLSFAFHVGKDIIVNGRNIFHEIETAVDEYKVRNFRSMGFYVG